MRRVGGRLLGWELGAATGLSLVLVLLAAPARDECYLIPESLSGISGFESEPRLPLGIRCRYLGARGEVVAVVEHQVPAPLVVAVPVLAVATVLAGMRRLSGGLDGGGRSVWWPRRSVRRATAGRGGPGGGGRG